MSPSASPGHDGRACAASALLLLLLPLAGLAPAATAAVYTDSAGHYSFTFPTGWAPQATSEVDAVLVGPPEGGFSPNIVAAHESEPAAQNSSMWLLGYVRNSFDELKLQLNLTEVQATRTFTTGSGRLAGDYVFEREESGQTLRQRQVVFVSAHHHFVYGLTFSDKSSTYAAHEADWSMVVDSFTVTGEPAVTQSSGLPDWGIPVAMIGLGVAIMGAVEFRRLRSGRRPGAQLQTRARPVQPAFPPAPARRTAPEGPRGASMPGRPAIQHWAGETAPARSLSAGSPPLIQKSGVVPPRSAASWLPPPPVAPTATGRLAPLTPAPRTTQDKAEVIPPREGAGSPRRPSTIRCPKCKTQFPGPASRLVTVVCPNCGAKGVMK